MGKAFLKMTGKQLAAALRLDPRVSLEQFAGEQYANTGAVVMFIEGPYLPEHKEGDRLKEVTLDQVQVR